MVRETRHPEARTKAKNYAQHAFPDDEHHEFTQPCLKRRDVERNGVAEAGEAAVLVVVDHEEVTVPHLKVQRGAPQENLDRENERDGNPHEREADEAADELREARLSRLAGLSPRQRVVDRDKDEAWPGPMRLVQGRQRGGREGERGTVPMLLDVAWARLTKMNALYSGCVSPTIKSNLGGSRRALR